MQEEKGKKEQDDQQVVAPVAPAVQKPVPAMAGLPRPLPEHINAPLTAEGNTYLHELCRQKAPVELIVEAIRDLGAIPDLPNKHGLPALAMAVTEGYGEAVSALCAEGASVVTGKFNAVLYAVDSVRSEMLALVLKAGRCEGVNQGGLLVSKEETTETPLMLAVSRLQPLFAEMLLDAGALLDIRRERDGMTAIHLASGRKEPGILSLLVNAGGRVQIADNEGKTPLHEAASYGCVDSMKILIDAGADVDAVTVGGATPLHSAVLKKQAEAVKVLLAARAQVDVRLAETADETALMLAARRGYEEIVIELLVAGADALAENSEKQTAAALVNKQTHAELASFLDGEEVFRLQQHFERAYRGVVTRQTQADVGMNTGKIERKPPFTGVGR